MSALQQWEQRAVELRADLASLERSLARGTPLDLELAKRLEGLAQRIRRHVTDTYILAAWQEEQKP